MVRADQPGWMLISDIQIVQLDEQADIVMGVGGHDLQGTGWRQRLDNYEDYFGQKPSVGTYFTTILEPISEDSDADDHYSDIAQRADALGVLDVIPAVTLEFRSWAQITIANGTDSNAAEKIVAERERFNNFNRDKSDNLVLSYDDFINIYVNQNRVLDAVNAGLLDPILHTIADQMSELGPVYLRLFHEPYWWFPWGMRVEADIAKFRAAWVHIGQIFEQEGADNVMFVMTFDPAEPGGTDWSEVTAIPSQYLDVVELDGYTDPVLRQNAWMSANELFAKKLTEIAWQLEIVYPDPATRPSIALGEFAFTGGEAGRSKEQVYDWFIHDLKNRAYSVTRFSILYTHLPGPRPTVDGINYSPPQEGNWGASWQPEEWYRGLLEKLFGPTDGVPIDNEDIGGNLEDLNYRLLSQNYPNPFSQEQGTKINYNLPNGADKVNIRIYNVRGQLVKKFDNLRTFAGEHTIQWDATDSRGQRVASGVYFATIEIKQGSEAQRKTIKMTVLSGIGWFTRLISKFNLVTPAYAEEIGKALADTGTDTTKPAPVQQRLQPDEIQVGRAGVEFRVPEDKILKTMGDGKLNLGYNDIKVLTAEGKRYIDYSRIPEDVQAVVNIGDTTYSLGLHYIRDYNGQDFGLWLWPGNWNRANDLEAYDLSLIHISEPTRPY